MKARALIDQESALAELSATLSDARLVGLDTEFVRERTYFAQLCLIQLAVGERVVCVDCVGELDLGPLFEQLFRPGTRCIAHSARQDLEVFWHAAGTIPEQLIDTQIAAALLGFAPQVGLQELLEQTLGVSLDKAHTRTDWSKRPLSDAALRYAMDDVRYLLPLWRHLRAMLEERGRLEWLVEDCHRALGVQLEPDTTTLFRRLKGSGALHGEAVAVALALIDWRENRARRANRPRRWILADAVLVRLARNRPTRIDALRRIEGLSRRTIEKSGASILEAIGAADSDAVLAIQSELAWLEQPDASEVKALQKHVGERAAELGLESEVLAARRDLVAVSVGKTPPQLQPGTWRSAVLGLDRLDEKTSPARSARPRARS